MDERSDLEIVCNCPQIFIWMYVWMYVCMAVPTYMQYAYMTVIDLGMLSLTQIRIESFLRSTQDTQRGVKRLLAKLDGHVLSPPEGFLVRKAPGTQHYDYVQEIPFGLDQGRFTRARYFILLQRYYFQSRARDSTTRFVRQQVGWLVGRSRFTFFMISFL